MKNEHNLFSGSHQYPENFKSIWKEKGGGAPGENLLIGDNSKRIQAGGGGPWHDCHCNSVFLQLHTSDFYDTFDSDSMQTVALHS
ncbi:MAG: hypothetical protein IPK62_09215 [Bacteroidetes bacterium]|nr:hypothetical protein [Bacteroidota bacterium]